MIVRMGAPGYFSDVLMLVKVVESLVPTPFTAVMMAIAMPVAINPYSIAVAPVSSAQKSCNNLFMFDPHVLNQLGATTRKLLAFDHIE